jgi:hypothetical protein
MDELMNVGLQDELIADLTLELKDEPTFSSDKLIRKVINAIREVKRARKYPTNYTTEMIDKDLYEYYSNIRNISLYDYNQIGIEFQTTSSENGVSRAYMDREKLFSGIIPLAKL